VTPNRGMGAFCQITLTSCLRYTDMAVNSQEAKCNTTVNLPAVVFKGQYNREIRRHECRVANGEYNVLHSQPVSKRAVNNTACI